MPWKEIQEFVDTARNALKSADDRIKQYMSGNPLCSDRGAGVLRSRPRFWNERYYQYLIAESLVGWNYFQELDAKPGEYDLALFEGRDKSRCAVAMQMKLHGYGWGFITKKLVPDIKSLREGRLNQQHSYMVVFCGHPSTDTQGCIDALSCDLQSDESGLAPSLLPLRPGENFHYAKFETFSDNPQFQGVPMDCMVAAIEVA
jgi:hypothetical protein